MPDPHSSCCTRAMGVRRQNIALTFNNLSIFKVPFSLSCFSVLAMSCGVPRPCGLVYVAFLWRVNCPTCSLIICRQVRTETECLHAPAEVVLCLKRSTPRHLMHIWSYYISHQTTTIFIWWATTTIKSLPHVRYRLLAARRHMRSACNERWACLCSLVPNTPK